MTPLLAVPGIAGIGDEEIVMQSSWDFKKDRARAAEVAKALNVIVKARHRKQQTTNLWVQNRVNGMLALCQLFASSNSRLSWTRASELAAEAVGHGCPTYARKLRHWTVEFERLGMDYSSLPLTRHGRFNTQRLLDEDLSTKIHEFLLQLRRDQPYFNADDIVNFISTPAMQSAMGTKATTICKKTAQRWLKQMGWRYGKMSNGMYLDGHEREDVVEYRTWFLAEYKKLEGRMRRYDRDGNIDKLPELQEGERAIREVTHDESTFYANDRRKQGYWHSDEVKKPVRKDDGVSIMVADFLTPEIGRLKDEIRCVQPNYSSVADSPLCSVKPECSSRQERVVMGIGRARMSSLKHRWQSRSLSAIGLKNKAYSSMTMRRYTKNEHQVHFPRQKCPKEYRNGSPVQAYGCATGGFLMAHPSPCITLTTIQSPLASSKGCNRSYTSVAYSPPIET